MGNHGAGQLTPLNKRQPIRRTKKGAYAISLPQDQRELLKTLPEQLQTMLTQHPEAAALRRLQPPAYVDDKQANDEYLRLVGDDLTTQRMETLGLLSRTANAIELTAEEMHAWMQALNSIRLWLGTMLDVSEDDFNPTEPMEIVYYYLTELQWLIIEVLSEGLEEES